jgi:hypothetical protein
LTSAERSADVEMTLLGREPIDMGSIFLFDRPRLQIGKDAKDPLRRRD